MTVINATIYRIESRLHSLRNGNAAPAGPTEMQHFIDCVRKMDSIDAEIYPELARFALIADSINPEDYEDD